MIYDTKSSISNGRVDGAGNLLGYTEFSFDGMNWNDRDTTNAYNSRNQISSMTVESAYSVSFAYDLNGNKVRETYTDLRAASVYTYGLDNQLKSLSTETPTTMPGAYGRNVSKKWFGYEIGGRLLRIKSDILDTTAINPAAAWTKTGDEYLYYNHDGLSAMKYTNGSIHHYARNGGELFFAMNASGTLEYLYLQNHRGDVVMQILPDKRAGMITDYAADGSVMASAPRTEDPFGFTAGINAGGGLVKLGARYYDSKTRGFMSQDRYLGDPADPLSLNRYVYCGQNPVNYADPSGFSPALAVLGTGWSVGGGLALVDGPLPFGDAAGVVVGAGASVAAGAIALGGLINTAVEESKERKLQSALLFISYASTAPTPLPPNDPRSRGTQTSSRTLYNKKGTRIDVENVGNRLGRVHLQQGESKYYYDAVKRVFTSADGSLAPRGVQDLLSRPDVIKAIVKGLKYLGY